MPTFAYTALNTQGKRTTGRLDADDRSAALVSIETLGLVPVDVSATAPGKSAVASSKSGSVDRVRFGAFGQRVKPKHVLAFVRQLGNLLAAGVPLARSLEILNRETSHPGAKAQWDAVREMVIDGTALADAIAQFPKSFPPIYVAMVRAGEAGGFLDVVLKQIADFMSRERELKSKVATALIYPVVLAVIATGVVIFLLTWFIPRFSTIFEEFGQTLPLLTRLIQGASYALLNYGLFVLIGIVLLLFIAKQLLSSEAGRRKRDEIVLKLPGIGAASAKFSLVRFCRMLGTLVGAGVPLISSLKVARAAIGNQTLTDAVDRAISNVQEGAPLARSLGECPQLFPTSVVEMVSVAEESGRISEELVRMAEEFEEELDRQLRVLVSLAEPAMLFVMASLVGAIVVGMLLPVFDLWDAIQ
ncbi:MAG: type II secretion system F family protein [Phycisphaeraceae bacterium]